MILYTYHNIKRDINMSYTTNEKQEIIEKLTAKRDTIGLTESERVRLLRLQKTVQPHQKTVQTVLELPIAQKMIDSVLKAIQTPVTPVTPKPTVSDVHPKTGHPLIWQTNIFCIGNGAEWCDCKNCKKYSPYWRQ